MFDRNKREPPAPAPALDFFQDFVNAVGASVVLLSTTRDILYMNDRAVKLWGSVEIGHKCHQSLRGSREVCRGCPFEEVVRTKRWARREMRVRTGEGWRDHETLYFYMKGQGRDVVVMVGMDVHEATTLKREVAREREKSRALLESINSIVLGFGEGGRVELVNRVAEEVTGYREREILDGGGIDMLIPADAIEAARSYFSEPHEGPRSEEPALIPLITRSGSRVMVSWTYTPSAGGEGSIGIAIGQDVTERFATRKEAEKRAAELEIVNAVLSRAGTAAGLEDLLAGSLELFLRLPAYSSGAAFILESGATEARKVAALGFEGSGPGELIGGTERVFPATAVYNRRIEVARAGTRLHDEVEKSNREERNSGMVAVPLFPGGHPLGLVVLGYRGDPTPEEMGMGVLKACADAIELGAENAFLRLRAEKRVMEATALLKVNQALTGATDLAGALQEVAKQIAGLLEVDVCGIFLFDEGSESIRMAAGYPAEAVGSGIMPDAPLRVHKVAAEVARTLKPVAVEDVASDERVPEYVSRDMGVRSSLHVPLVAEGRFIGTVYLATVGRSRKFTRAETELVETFSRQSSIAIRNASLLRDLSESEERYRTVMENSGVGFIVHDGRDFLYINADAGQIIGHDSTEFSTVEDILEHALPEDRRRIRGYVARRLAGDDTVPRSYDVKFKRVDGSVAVIQLVQTPMTIGGKKVTVVAANDVTDRVEAQQALKQSEERYRTLVESSRDAIMIADPRGTILFANSAGARLAGKPAGEVAGGSVYDFVHPDEMDATRRKFVREWEAGRNVSRFPVRSLVMGEERFFETTTVILGEPGPDANVMLIAYDVTDSTLAQRKLAESEGKYRTIVETSHDAIVSINRAGEVLYANRAAESTLGVEAGGLVGTNVLSFVHPDDRESAGADLARDFKIGKGRPNYELRCLRADGGVLFVEVNSGLVGWPGENAIEILVVRDVTERRRAGEERERRLKVEETLTGITARFVDPEDMDGAILFTLESLSVLLGGSTAFHVEIGQDGTTIARAFEWSGGAEQFTTGLRGRSIGEYPYLFSKLGSGEEVIFSDVGTLPDDVAGRFRDQYGIESFAAIPLFVREAFRGVLGYASLGARMTWSAPDLELLRETALTVSRALERKDFVEELAKSEKFRTRITENIGEGLVVLSNGLVTWTNSRMEELSGHSLAELEGRTLEALMPEPERFEETAGRMVRALLEDGTFSLEDRLKRADGALIDVQITVTALGMTEQGAGELLVTVQDVTEQKRMREEVEAAAEAYSTLFSSAGDAFIVHSIDGSIISANERATAYTGRELDELQTMNVRDLVPERLRPGYERLAGALSGEDALTFESRLLRKDGSTLPVEATSRRTRIWGEEVALSALRDISERKKAEEETEHRSAQLHSLNEIVRASTSTLDVDIALEEILKVTLGASRADAGMVLLAPGPGRKQAVIVVDPRAGADRLGLDEDRTDSLVTWLSTRWQGSLLVELGGPGAASVPPFAGGLAEKGMEQALFIPLYSGEKSIGVILLGSRAAGTFEERDLAFYDAAGAEIGVSIENALIYRQLAAEHERLSLLYRSAQGISAELELQTLLERTVAEAARAVGSRAALIGLVEPGRESFAFGASCNLDASLLDDLHLLVDEGIGGAVVSKKRTIIIGGEHSLDEETRQMVATDQVLQRTGVDFAAALPLIAGDEVVGVFALERPSEGRDFSAEDILLLEAIGRQAGVAIQNARLYEETRRHMEALEAANRELTVLDRMKSDFVSTVSHELRSPLAVIEGFARTLSEHYDQVDEETRKDSIEIMLKKSIALEDLIENILDMSRIEEGRLEVAREPFDISALCREVGDEQERVEGLHEVVYDIPGSPLMALGDREKTEVALGNLVRNALKFSPDGGRVTISAKQAGEMVEIGVRDEGIGVPPELRERIFERFYQIDSSETRSFPGTGLGLYIARELVESMGGEVGLSSDPGVGSLFTLTLPLA